MVVGKLNNQGIDWDAATDEEIKAAARSVAGTLKKLIYKNYKKVVSL